MNRYRDLHVQLMVDGEVKNERHYRQSYSGDEKDLRFVVSIGVLFAKTLRDCLSPYWRDRATIDLTIDGVKVIEGMGWGVDYDAYEKRATEILMEADRRNKMDEPKVIGVKLILEGNTLYENTVPIRKENPDVAGYVAALAGVAIKEKYIKSLMNRITIELTVDGHKIEG